MKSEPGRTTSGLDARDHRAYVSVQKWTRRNLSVVAQAPVPDVIHEDFTENYALLVT